MTQLNPVSCLAFAQGNSDERSAFVQAFGDSLRIHGFGLVTDHGIERMRIERAFALSAAFFASEMAAKEALRVPASKGNRGYVPMGGERALGAKAADLKEFFHVGQLTTAPGLLPNVWPDHVQGFREEMQSLYRDFEALAGQLLQSIALYLGLAQDHFASMIIAGDSILRLIHYPAVPGDAAPGAVRAAAHEDINLITLLAEGSTGGLELRNHDGSFSSVTSQRGTLVINAGDMLQLASHGRIRSTTHRVVNPVGDNVARYSIPFFTHPRPDILLEPMAPEADNARRFEAITAGEFLRQRLRAITPS
ncbi:MAG: 2-oxoglutarate and iron-dependent oxygenase domain-containing protein [Deltaproteobacteria bacterium]|nr:2-oxoglutarate and iron-dependent oxygenase domain-containing protein [Deltaproteobacteria bacterium]